MQQEQTPKIENCPICEKPLEVNSTGAICMECKVTVNIETGEICRTPKPKPIIGGIMGKLKNFMWSWL